MNQYLIYKHINLTDLKTFYIGMSINKNRPKDFKNRTKQWFNIFNNNKIEVYVVSENLTKEDALELERFLIEESDGLVNQYYNGYKTWNKNKKLSEQHKSNLKENSGLAKKVICLDNNNIYNSATDAVKINNLNYSISHFKNMLNKKRTNKTNFRWV